MAVNIKHDQFAETYDIEVTGINEAQARKVIDMFLWPVAEPRPSLADMPQYQQQGLIKAADVFSHFEKNKIEQIKFVRSLADISLREAKELIEYATFYSSDGAIATKPLWFKND